MKAAIYIGIKKSSVEAAQKCILGILKAKNSDQVKLAALTAMATMLHLSSATITNCVFKGVK